MIKTFLTIILDISFFLSCIFNIDIYCCNCEDYEIFLSIIVDIYFIFYFVQHKYKQLYYNIKYKPRSNIRIRTQFSSNKVAIED